MNNLAELSGFNTETVATLQYMAPEAMAKSQYTSSSDIYAFGIVAFEILFERQAFQDLEGFDLINAVVSENMRPVIPEDLDNKLRTLLNRCWAPNPDQRPTADWLCKRLLKILKSQRNNSLGSLNR